LLDAEDVDVVVPMPVLHEDLRRVGLYVKDNVIADALKQAGE